MGPISDPNEIRIGTVVYHAIRDELLFVVNRAIQLPAWKCFVLKPSAESIRIFYLSDDEIRKTAFPTAFVSLGKWLCPPEGIDEILKFSKAGREILVDLYYKAANKLYSNLP